MDYYARTRYWIDHYTRNKQDRNRFVQCIKDHIAAGEPEQADYVNIIRQIVDSHLQRLEHAIKEVNFTKQERHILYLWMENEKSSIDIAAVMYLQLERVQSIKDEIVRKIVNVMQNKKERPR